MRGGDPLTLPGIGGAVHAPAAERYGDWTIDLSGLAAKVLHEGQADFRQEHRHMPPFYPIFFSNHEKLPPPRDDMP